MDGPTIQFLPFSRPIDELQNQVQPSKIHAVNLCVSALVYLGWKLGVAKKKRNICGDQSGFKKRK